MATVVETEILRKAITGFHTQKPHSQVRKTILRKTYLKLKEESDGWTEKKVRTWFWNHRTEVKEFNERTKDAKRKVTRSSSTEPPKKKAKIAQTPENESSEEDEEEENNIPAPSLSKRVVKSRRKKDYKKEVHYEGNTTDNDDDIDSFVPTATSLRAFCASESVKYLLNELEPKNEDVIRFITSNMKIYRIYACHAVGNDLSSMERWIIPTMGSICFYKHFGNGRIRWKHDPEYNTVSGSIRVESAEHDTFSGSKWCRYTLHGKVGSMIMLEQQKKQEDDYSLFLKPVTKDNVVEINQEADERRKQDRMLFGNEESNNFETLSSLRAMTNDLCGKVQFHESLGGLVCGVHFQARLVTESSLSIHDSKLVLRTLQDVLRYPSNIP